MYSKYEADMIYDMLKVVIDKLIDGIVKVRVGTFLPVTNRNYNTNSKHYCGQTQILNELLSSTALVRNKIMVLPFINL